MAATARQQRLLAAKGLTLMGVTAEGEASLRRSSAALSESSGSLLNKWRNAVNRLRSISHETTLGMKRRWVRQLGRSLQILIGLIALLYLGDWAVLEFRVAHGTAYSTVEVSQFLATSLKGNKTEYDLMGTAQETCTRSIFPQRWHPPCWWLNRHTSQWEE